MISGTGLEVATKDRYFGKRLKRMISMIRLDIAHKVRHTRGGQLTPSVVSVAALSTDLRYIIAASFCRAAGCILALACAITSFNVDGVLEVQTSLAAVGSILIFISALAATWISIRVYQW